MATETVPDWSFRHHWMAQAATHALMQGVSADERNRLYHLNAKRLWSL